MRKCYSHIRKFTIRNSGKWPQWATVRFQDFTKISRFHVRFQRFQLRFQRESVRDFSKWRTPRFNLCESSDPVLNTTEESGTRAAITTPQYVFEEAVNEPLLSHNYVSPARIYRNMNNLLRMSSEVFPVQVYSA